MWFVRRQQEELGCILWEFLLGPWERHVRGKHLGGMGKGGGPSMREQRKFGREHCSLSAPPGYGPAPQCLLDLAAVLRGLK